MKLQRRPASPILLPGPSSDWESYNVFNPSVVYYNGLFHMHYGAQGLAWISRIGYAASLNGIHWNRLRRRGSTRDHARRTFLHVPHGLRERVYRQR